MTKIIMAFGEVLWDILPSCVVLGGAPFNFVYRVNCLGDTGLMVSRLGRDDLGRQACDKVVSLGLDTVLLQRDDDAPTGTVQVSFDADNNPDYVIVPDVAYDRIVFTDALRQAAARADGLCFGTLIQRSEASRATLAEVLQRTPRALKLLDINLRKDCYDPGSVAFSLQEADCDIPPGCANLIRLVSILYVLDQEGYDGWFGLDLFPYRDDSVDFMKLSVENLRFGQAVVDLMNARGAGELRAKGTDGPAMSRLIRDCIREAK